MTKLEMRQGIPNSDPWASRERQSERRTFQCPQNNLKQKSKAKRQYKVKDMDSLVYQVAIRI